MQDRGRVFAGFSSGTAVLKIEGHATWQIATLFRRFEEENSEGLLTSERLVYDLTRCDFLDSTLIGLVSRLGVKYYRQNNRLAVVLYSGDKVRNILELMNCHRILSLIPGFPEEPDGASLLTEVIQTEPLDRAALRQAMLLAHQALVELNEQHTDEMEQVVEDLELKPKSGTPQRH